MELAAETTRRGLAASAVVVGVVVAAGNGDEGKRNGRE